MSMLDFLGRKLESSDAEDRREAVIDLGRAVQRDRDAVPLLLRAMGDADWRVRKTAVEALVAKGGDEVTAGLVRCLSAEDNAGARNSAIEALVRIGPGAVVALLPLLSTDDPDVRKFAVDILGDIRDTRAVPGLIEKLSDDDENVCVAAAEALGKIKDRRAVDALIACLSRYDQGWLDYAAAEALGEIGDDRALGPLIAALGRSSLREPVLESLGRIGNVNTLSPLIAGLSDPLRIVREVSTVALFTIYRKCAPRDRENMIRSARSGVGGRAVDFLEELLETTAGDLQKAAITVLGWLGKAGSVAKLLSLLGEEAMEEPVAQALVNVEEQGVPLLLERLTNENALVRRVAARVLGDLDRAEAEGPLIGMLGDENGHVRSTAAESLGRMKSRKAVAPLLGLLEDEYENVQECAVRALAAIGDESILDGLVNDFTARDAGMRRNIVRILGKFASDKASDALVFALKDEEPAVRKAVVLALGNLENSRALKPLMLAITDDDPEVRMLAAEGLGKMSSSEAADALTFLLDDEDIWVRAAAARALGRIGADRFGAVLASHLKDASDIFLLALVDVVGRAAVAEAFEPLLALADHRDHEVRKTVLLALPSYDWSRIRDVVLAHLFDPHWSVRKSAVEILGNRRDASCEPVLERMAEQDPDQSVRQAAREALRR